MRRKLFTSLSAMSLLLVVATAVLWVRGNRRIDSLTLFQRYDVSSYLGGLNLYIMNANEMERFSLASDPVRPADAWDGSQYRTPTLCRFAGFLFTRGQLGSNGGMIGPTVSYVAVRVPDWSVLGIASIVPVIWLIRWQRQHRHVESGRCPWCKYDLTGNISGRCPECGNAIEATTPKAAVRFDLIDNRGRHRKGIRHDGSLDRRVHD